MDKARAAYDELYVYTMTRPGFILQHVVDAFCVQTAPEDGPPIGVVFGLVGLFLRVERQFSGRQIQEVHKKLGRAKRQLPRIDFPKNRGRMSALDVLSASAGIERDKAIDNWCRSVWISFSHNRQAIISLLADYRIT